MIKLVLLTGFLGAGKTTFLNHILEEYRDRKIGLIVNEFSETGIDGALVHKQDEDMDMIELTNGSIFCACIKDKFVDALIALSGKDIEYAFIEASGLADPASISSILEGIRKHTENPYEYCGSVCLADAVYFLKYVKVLPALSRQVEYSRAVIINKTDLATEEEVQEVVEKIRELNPDTDIFKTTYGQVSMEEILSGKKDGERKAQETTNTEQTRPKTVTLVTDEEITEEKLKQFLDEITPSTYRVKGFVKVCGGTREVSAVGTYAAIRQWPVGVAETNLVIISSVGIRIVSIVLEAAGKYFEKEVRLKH